MFENIGALAIAALAAGTGLAALAGLVAFRIEEMRRYSAWKNELQREARELAEPTPAWRSSRTIGTW